MRDGQERAHSIAEGAQLEEVAVFAEPHVADFIRVRGIGVKCESRFARRYREGLCLNVADRGEIGQQTLGCQLRRGVGRVRDGELDGVATMCKFDDVGSAIFLWRVCIGGFGGGVIGREAERKAEGAVGVDRPGL